MANDSGKLPSKVETIHLKVYIHCEGCRKKVKKILTRMEGVYTVDINASLGKVTVTGTVDSKSLMKKLEKAGKVVELWPSPPGLGGNCITTDGGKTPNPGPMEKDKQENKEQKGPSPPAPQGKEEKKDNKEAKPKKEEEGGNKDAKPKSVENGHSKDGVESQKGESAKEAASPSAAKSQNGTSNGHSSPGLKGNVGENGDKNNTTNNNTTNKKKKGGGGGNANNSNSSSNSDDTTSTKKSNVEVQVEEGDSQAPKVANNVAGSEAPKGTSNGRKKGGRDVEDNATSNGSEFFSEAGTSSVHIMNKNLAPPPMVLVETNEYDYFMESQRQEDYGTHIFSDENANNCSIM